MPPSTIALWLIVGAVVGGLIGWGGSLVARADTNAAIYLAIVAGVGGGMLGPVAVGFNSSVDSVLASTLAAMVLSTLFAFVEKRIDRRRNHLPEQP